MSISSIHTNYIDRESFEDKFKEIPFLFNVARGKIDNAISVNKFGKNGDIDAASGYEDIISMGGTLDLTLVGDPTEVTVVSSDAADDIGGAGAEIVTVYGLDANYNLQSEDITLSGTTAVTSTGVYNFVYRAQVIQSANGANTAFNAGTITFAKSGGNDVMEIPIGYNQTMHCAYMIPAGYEGFLIKHDFHYRSAPATDGGTVQVLVKDFDKPFSVKYEALVTDGYSIITEIHNPLKLDEKSIIKLRADTGQDNTVWSASFDLILLPKFT